MILTWCRLHDVAIIYIFSPFLNHDNSLHPCLVELFVSFSAIGREMVDLFPTKLHIRLSGPLRHFDSYSSHMSISHDHPLSSNRATKYRNTKSHYSLLSAPVATDTYYSHVSNKLVYNCVLM
jgi:hypothetical protein